MGQEMCVIIAITGVNLWTDRLVFVAKTLYRHPLIKLTMHLMFGVIMLFADQLLRLIT